MPKIKTEHVSMRLPKDLKRAMVKLAKRDKVTLTEMVEPILRAAFAPDTVPLSATPPETIMENLRRAAPAKLES